MRSTFGVKIVSLLVLLVVLAGCSDSGGGDNGESGSNWDEMKWDQGKWG